MLEENKENKQEKDLASDYNNSKPNFVNQIDDIINKYKTQLEQLKTNSNLTNQEHSIETLPVISSATLQSKTIFSLIEPPELKYEKIKNNVKSPYSSDLLKEIQNDNIKLQSSLTAEKINTFKLNSQIENYEIELNKSKKEILDLQNQISKRENEFMTEINNIYNDINKIKEENIINIHIIQNFFELFNKNIDLFNKSKIISLDQNSRLNYIENDYEGKNQELSIFVINSLNILINKLLHDNKELYEQLIETKKIFDEQNIIQREIEGIKDIKKENLILKTQLENLIQENRNLKNDNIKLKNNLIEINNYINNMNKFRFNPINNIASNTINNNINNYKRQRINSYQEYNNKNNFNENVNNDINLNNFKDYNNNRNKNIKNKAMNKNNENSINNNDNSKKYNSFNNNINIIYKTDENIKTSNCDLINNNSINKDNIYTSNNNENSKNIETGFERPIEQLKKKIMLLEKQIKNSPEQ